MTIHDHVSELSAVVASLQTEVAALRAGRRRSRLRALVPILTLLCLISLSLTMIPVTRAQSPDGAAGPENANPVASQPITEVETEKPAASPNTTGQPLLIGQPNSPSTVNDSTVLVTPGSTQLMQNTFRVNNFTTTSLADGLIANRRVAIVGSVSGPDTTTNERMGVIGATDAGSGVYGYSSGPSSSLAGIGVRGEAPNNGIGLYGKAGRYGGYFEGTRAPIYLFPNSTAGAPTTGQHFMGELVVSSDGHLWFCRADGTPGQWVRLDLSATFVPLVQK